MSNTAAAYNFFDTHAFVKELEGVGFTEKQAELLSKKQAELVEHKLATKQDILALASTQKKDILDLKKDILALEASLKKDMQNLEASLKRDIHEMSYKLTIRMGGMFVAMIGILSAIKFFG
jgi:hypothetical protein